jgi:thiamine biosynthesis lipoprotein
MERGVAATSGRDYRRWLAGGKPVHHLIDPRTGLSAETDVLAVTVVAPHAWQAEAGAKAALIQGSRNGLDWLQHKEELEGLMITEQGEVLETKGLVRYGWTG